MAEGRGGGAESAVRRGPAAMVAAARVRRRAGWAADAKVREERAAEAAAEATAREKRLNMKYKGFTRLTACFVTLEKRRRGRSDCGCGTRAVQRAVYFAARQNVTGKRW
jgi:hypothetical protein